MKRTDPPIILEYPIASSRAIAWSALTNHEEMIQWFFENIPDFKPEVGFQTQFPVESSDRTFTHLWGITEVIPEQKITYSWKYKEYEGDSLATFELIEAEGVIKIKLTLNILEDFQSGIPEFVRESCIGGWDYFLGQRFTAYLETKK